jgi:RNA polymerase sigma factor for flagellar operon FliA
MSSAICAYASQLENPALPRFVEFLEEYSPLVRKIAQHLQFRLPSSVDLDDLLQAGMIGLVEAYRNFDGDKGASIKTYASIRVRGAMIDELRRIGWFPRSVQKNLRNLAEGIRQFEQRIGREPSDQELASQLGISIDQLRSMMSECSMLQFTALDDAELDENAFSENGVNSIPRPDDVFMQEHFGKRLVQALDELPERERQVLALYYIEEMNLKEIGAVLGVTESRISQLHARAMVRLNSDLAAWSAS